MTGCLFSIGIAKPSNGSGEAKVIVTIDSAGGYTTVELTSAEFVKALAGSVVAVEGETA